MSRLSKKRFYSTSYARYQNHNLFQIMRPTGVFYYYLQYQFITTNKFPLYLKIFIQNLYGHHVWIMNTWSNNDPEKLYWTTIHYSNRDQVEELVLPESVSFSGLTCSKINLLTALNSVFFFKTLNVLSSVAGKLVSNSV